MRFNIVVRSTGTAIGDIYLQAQNELVVNDDPAAAASHLTELRSKPLNCYEEGAVLGLSAQIKLAQEDYLGAAGDLRASLDGGSVLADQRAQTFKALGQIYLAEDRYDDGLLFMSKWIEAGGEPARDEKWTLASVYALQDSYQEAIFWAEQALEADGENVNQPVLDFLAYLYTKTDQPEKKAGLPKASN